MSDKLLLAPGETADSEAMSPDGTLVDYYPAGDPDIQAQRRIGYEIGKQVMRTAVVTYLRRLAEAADNPWPYNELADVIEHGDQG